MSSASMHPPAASLPPARSITFLEPPRNSPITPDRTASRPNPCFNCNQEGHWFRDCPLRRSPPIPAAVAAAGAPAPLKCHCGSACSVLTSHTEKNPGRQFYRCPVLPKEKKCKFFKWCDEVIAGQINGPGSQGKWQQRNDVSSPRKQAESSPPICSCGAGRARILTMEKGECYGRQYYGCHIKKGQGACNFFQWRKEEAPETKVPLFNLVPGEPNARILANGVGETSTPERIMTYDVSFVRELPLLSSRDHRPYHKPKRTGDQFSPIKKLSLDESSPSSIAATPRICFKCGNNAYWMSKCGHCFKCDIAETMATGVGETEVGNAQEWMVSDVSVIPELSLSSVYNHQDHQSEHAEHVEDGVSPIQRLSLDENFHAATASKLRKCFKCGTEGHWMSGRCLKCDEAEMATVVVGEANVGTGPERLASDGWIIPEHLQSSRGHHPNGWQDDQPTFVVHGFSPSKRLSLDESSSKCLKCGKDGHWMSECQPCLKCGKVGHRMRDCTAYTVWW